MKQSVSFDSKKQQTLVDEIIGMVSNTLGVSLKAMCGKERHRDYVIARHMAMSLTRELTDMNLATIGAVFNRDHASVIHAIKRNKERMEIHDGLADRYYEIKAIVENED